MELRNTFLGQYMLLYYTQLWDAFKFGWVKGLIALCVEFILCVERQLFAQSNHPYLCMWHGKSKTNLDFAVAGQGQLASVLMNMGNTN